MTDQYELQWTSVNSHGRICVTAIWGGTTVAVDELFIRREKNRKALLGCLMAKRPEADSMGLESALLDMANDVALLTEKAKEPPATVLQKTSDDLLRETSEAVKSAAVAILESPDLLKRAIRDVGELGVAGETDLIAAIYLTGVSRHLSKPLAMIVQGTSSSGKSHAIDTVATLFPPECLIHATQMTPQALFHMPEGSLQHRFVIAGERSRLENDDRAEATRGLREMLGSGRLCKLMPQKVGGEIQTLQIMQEGPIAFVESTTASEIFAEDANRCVIVNTDERPEQTARVLRSLAAMYSGDDRTGRIEGIIERHHAIQRILQPYSVSVPFADRLAEMLPHDRVETRRAFPQIVSMVQACALLHQRQRKMDADGRVVACADDYAIARHILLHPMARSVGRGVSEPSARFYEKLKVWFTADDIWSAADAGVRETYSPRSVRGWVGELYAAGLLELVEGGRGRSPRRWRVVFSASADEASAILPPGETICTSV